VLRLKGGAGYAVGLAIREVVHAIALNRRALLPVSSLQRGCYGIQGVCLSVPTVMGRQGVLDHMEIELWAREKNGIENSARVLRETLRKIKQ
jgi:L-lactate dehydrogenase